MTSTDMLTSSVTLNILVVAECSQARISSFTGAAGVPLLTGWGVAVDEDATGLGISTGVGGLGFETLATEEAGESG